MPGGAGGKREGAGRPQGSQKVRSLVGADKTKIYKAPSKKTASEYIRNRLVRPITQFLKRNPSDINENSSNDVENDLNKNLVEDDHEIESQIEDVSVDSGMMDVGSNKGDDSEKINIATNKSKGDFNQNIKSEVGLDDLKLGEKSLTKDSKNEVARNGNKIITNESHEMESDLDGDKLNIEVLNLWEPSDLGLFVGQALPFMQNGCMAEMEDRRPESGQNYTCAIDSILGLLESLLTCETGAFFNKIYGHHPIIQEAASIIG